MVNVGPSHPSTHGVCRVIVHLDGEIVIKVDPVIGYLHRGIEKMAENRTYLQVVPLTDRLDYVGSHVRELGVLPRGRAARGHPRARARRVPARHHLRAAAHREPHDGASASSAADTGAFTMFIYAFDVRERIIELFEELCGSRLTYNYVRPGGVSFDAARGLGRRRARRSSREHRRRQLDEMDRLFFGNVHRAGRLKGVGVLIAEDAVGVGRHRARARAAAASNWDLRKHDPYSVYPRFDFDVVVGDNGDAYDRGRVRLFECYESARIIEQALDADARAGPCTADGAAAAHRAARRATPTTTSSARAGRSASTSSPTGRRGRTA